MANIYTKLPPAHNHDQVYAKIGEGGVTDHGALTGLEDNDHPQYLLTTGKAADSDKLDGQLASYYALATHDHNGVYIPLTNFAGYTGTVVGWSGTPDKVLTYAVIGKLLLMSVYINGTSNSTTTSVTIPSGLTSASQGVSQILPVRVIDNGVILQTPGIAILEDNGTVIDFYTNYSGYKNYAGAAWTSTGTKQVHGNFAWIIA